VSPPPPRQSPSAPPAERKVAVLGPTLRFKGELSADEDFILQGRLEGAINHTQSVTIGTEGIVQGDIHARVVIIDGAVEGDLHGIESVVVHATGRVTGNIFAPRVGLVEGAFFSGRIEMPQPPARASATPPTPGVVMSAEETARILGAKS
jgi:cytoskeletal protein CcmA (bactofilin family)